MTEPQPILDAAHRLGASEVEVYAVDSEETPVRFEANRLKELNSRHSSGVAVRVICYSHDDPGRPGCGEQTVLLTTMLDPAALPASAVSRQRNTRLGRGAGAEA